jgi:large subunit ribosomal protein L31
MSTGYNPSPLYDSLLACLGRFMKTGIHPGYFDLSVTCSCGNKFVTCSTMDKGKLHLEVCSKCHPFYTGKQKIVDTAGRVDKFQQKYADLHRFRQKDSE